MSTRGEIQEAGVSILKYNEIYCDWEQGHFYKGCEVLVNFINLVSVKMVTFRCYHKRLDLTCYV